MGRKSGGGLTLSHGAWYWRAVFADGRRRAVRPRLLALTLAHAYSFLWFVVVLKRSVSPVALRGGRVYNMPMICP